MGTWPESSSCCGPQWECPADHPQSQHNQLTRSYAACGAAGALERPFLTAREERDSQGRGQEQKAHLRGDVSGSRSKPLSCNHQKRLWLCLSGKRVSTKPKSSQDKNSRLDHPNIRLKSGLAANNFYSRCIIKKPFSFISQAVHKSLKCPFVAGYHQ